MHANTQETYWHVYMHRFSACPSVINLNHGHWQRFWRLTIQGWGQLAVAILRKHAALLVKSVHCCAEMLLSWIVLPSSRKVLPHFSKTLPSWGQNCPDGSSFCPLSSSGQEKGCFQGVHIPERGVWLLSKEQGLGVVLWAKWDSCKKILIMLLLTTSWSVIEPISVLEGFAAMWTIWQPVSQKTEELSDDDQEDVFDSVAAEVYGLGGAEAPETLVD